MDVLEKMNRRFGAWYEGLFGSRGDDELRPKDILRRIVISMEDARREGLDGAAYVPNVYTLRVVVETDDERHYLRTFLDADELAGAVASRIRELGYKTRGPLLFAIEEVEPTDGEERVQIRCRFDATVAAPERKSAEPETPAPGETSAAENAENDVAPPDEELHTAPASFLPLATLLARGPDGKTDEIGLTLSGLRIGRGKQARNDLVLNDAQVSKQHARIAFTDGHFVLFDDGSTNGTRLNGAILAAKTGAPLRDGDEISLGQTTLLFRGGESRTVPAARVAPEIAPTLPFPRVESAPRLIGTDGESYALASRMLVGRALTDDIVLIGAGVSAQHARLTVRDGAVFVEDLDTPGGTTVNGERIPANFPIALFSGDTIAFGAVALRLTQEFRPR